MKICLVCSFPFHIPGGVREHVFGLYKQFKKKGHKVKIIFPCRWPAQKSPHRDIILLGGYIKIPANKDRGLISFCNNSDQKIQKFLAKEKFDVIHFHEPLVPFLSFQILRHSKATNIITIHTFPEASSFIKFMLITTKHLSGRITEKFQGVIAVSETAKKFAQKIVKGKIVIIPNGVELSRFSPKTPQLKKFQDEKFNILFVGRLTKRKGLIYLLKAYRKLKKKYQNIRLIVVGDGDQKSKAKIYAKIYGLKDVHFEGVIPDEAIPSYYATADIFCSPATEGESFGIVLLEAMASGKPILAYANEGYKGVLKGFGKKSLVSPKNVEALAKKLEELINDEKLRKNLIKWGLEEVKRYSWEKVASQVLDFYKITLLEVSSWA